MSIEHLAEKYGTWLVGMCVTIAIYLNNLRITKLKEENAEAEKQRDKAKKEVEQICERLEKVEEVDKSAYPAFVKMQADFANLYDTVRTHHETRLQGLATANERLGENFNLKLENAVKRVDGLEKRLDKIDDKLDRIITAIAKIPHD